MILKKGTDLKLLVLSFYYEPDLCAGSFRTTALVNALNMHEGVQVDVVSTLPNRYASFSADAPKFEKSDQTTIHRVALPDHNSGMIDQAKAFFSYYKAALKIVDKENYDMVYATSSRLFTAFLGARIAKKKKIPLYLDIRDIFVDTVKDVLSPKLTWFAKPLFSMVERYSFSSAKRINLVSEGFKGYFQARYPKQQYRWFTNGIDDVFLNQPVCEQEIEGQSVTNILYAGNIGEGQGLHTIIPQLANSMGNKVKFTVIGDGGRKPQLLNEIKNLSNVDLFPPVNRDDLIKAYLEADVLFLHLNDYPAFKKVLPSKIFEYAALGKPIWAGVSGYAAEFLNKEVTNSAVFYPSNLSEALKSFSLLSIANIEREPFINKFSRRSIMSEMAADIVEFAKNDKE